VRSRTILITTRTAHTQLSRGEFFKEKKEFIGGDVDFIANNDDDDGFQ